MTAAKPLPLPDQDTAPFWEALREHRLTVQRCERCGHHQHYPRLLCTGCGSREVVPVEVAGTGTVYATTIVRRAPSPAFADDVPYVVALVQLDEGPRLLANVVGCPVDDVAIGQPVTVVYDDVTPEVTLYRFRPVDAAEPPDGEGSGR